MMLERAADAKAINAVLNHPGVKPWVSLPGQADLDFGEFIADRRNVVLMGEGGGLIFHWLAPGIFEVHTQFLPEHRGAGALMTVRAALAWIFAHGAEVLLTKVPVNNRAADRLARLIGGELIETRDDDWPTQDGLIPSRIYRLTRERWGDTCQQPQR